MLKGLLIPNNAGLVTTTAGGQDLVHTLSTRGITTVAGVATRATAKLRKILAYNNTGAMVTLIFGSWDVTLAVWVPLMPAISCVNGVTTAVPESEIPDVIWYPDRTVGAGNGLEGNIRVRASGAGVLLRCTVEEFGR